MLGISLGELLIILLVAVLILKPSDLPEVLEKIKKIKLELAKFYKDIDHLTGDTQDQEQYRHPAHNRTIDIVAIEKIFLDAEPIKDDEENKP